MGGLSDQFYLFYFETGIATNDSSIIFAARNKVLSLSFAPAKGGHFLKRFEKDPPVGNASRV
jgi:hypothetical protein